jgi:hypothetical protein
MHNVRTWKHISWKQEQKKSFCRNLTINKMCDGRTWKHIGWRQEEKRKAYIKP